MPRNLNEINVHEFGFRKKRGEILITQGRLLTHVVNIAWEIIDRYSVNIPQSKYTEWQRQLSCVHSIMMEKLAQADEGGGCTPTPFHIPSRTKLWCTLHQIHSLYFYSTPIWTVSYMMKTSTKVYVVQTRQMKWSVIWSENIFTKIFYVTVERSIYHNHYCILFEVLIWSAPLSQWIYCSYASVLSFWQVRK